MEKDGAIALVTDTMSSQTEKETHSLGAALTSGDGGPQLCTALCSPRPEAPGNPALRACVSLSVIHSTPVPEKDSSSRCLLQNKGLIQTQSCWQIEREEDGAALELTSADSMPIIQALGRLRQDDGFKFKVSLGYLVSSRPV